MWHCNVPVGWFFIKERKLSYLFSLLLCTCTMNEDTMDVVLFEVKENITINILLLISTSTLNQPSVSLKLEQREWLWQTLCVQLPVCVGSCWLLEKYEQQGHGELVRTKLPVMEPGVRRSAVRRRSSLATILIRIIIQTTQSFRHIGTGWLSDFSVTGSPTPAGDISVISPYSHSLFSQFKDCKVYHYDRIPIPHICHERHEYTRVNFFWPV